MEILLIFGLIVLVAGGIGAVSGGVFSSGGSGCSSDGCLGGTVSGRLNASQIQALAATAGFAGSDLLTAVAIALAESSGNPSAVGDLNITLGGSIGLWQINLKAHPEYTAAQLMDPQTNANAAFAVYLVKGSSFTPWSTYNNGAYVKYLPTMDSTVACA